MRCFVCPMEDNIVLLIASTHAMSVDVLETSAERPNVGVRWLVN